MCIYIGILPFSLMCIQTVHEDSFKYKYKLSWKIWLSQNKYMYGLKIAGMDQVSFRPVPVLTVVKIIWGTVWLNLCWPVQNEFMSLSKSICYWYYVEYFCQINHILMHLQMQLDVWLDNVINLRQYILRYTVANPTSLHNVIFIGWQVNVCSWEAVLCSWQPLDV